MMIGNLPFSTKVNKSLWFEFFPVHIQNWLADSKKIINHGTRKLPSESILCHEVEITTNELSRILYINTETYLLEALYVPEGNYILRILEYQIIDGYLFPTKEVTLRYSTMIGFKKYSKVVFNQQLPAKIFDKLTGDK